MIPDNFFAYRTVIVQGHPVTLTTELVNEYFQVPNFPEPVGGWVEHEFFQFAIGGSMTKPRASLGCATYNRLVKKQNTSGDAPAADDEMEVEQDQNIAQPQSDDCNLAAIAAMQVSFEGHMEGMEARLNNHLDVMEAGMIDMESRLSTRMDAMVARMEKIDKTLHQTYACRQAGPSWISTPVFLTILHHNLSHSVFSFSKSMLRPAN
ncbi:hypothetical protein ACOSQ3_031576 [Xanthoceras sorbifolium]